MEIDPETAKLLDALLPNTAFDGWTTQALRQALTSLGRNPDEAKLLFASDTDMIEAYFALADQRMVEAATGLEGGLTSRVRKTITLRLEQMAGDKEAIRRAISRLTLPSQAPRLARTIAASADSIWFAAGDTSADFSWYTKRFTLGAVWLATLLFWLSDDSSEAEATLAFLNRRLEGVGRIGKARAKTSERLSRLIPRRPAWPA
jgi:ubiquinone biosynthesis protein COQ9